MSLSQLLQILNFVFRSTLYDLGNNGWTRIFYHLTKTNKRERMFDVKGRHTFFLPVDAAFDVSTNQLLKVNNEVSMISRIYISLLYRAIIHD